MMPRSFRLKELMSAELARIHNLVRPYTEKNDLRALWEVLSTLIVFVPLGILLYCYRDHVVIWWLGSIPAALLLVRLFSLGHEAGHAALFRSRRTNQWIGRFLALVSLIPYGCWHRMHYVHHQSIGKVGGDHEGYMWLMTKQEYRSCSRVQRVLYRMYHHPITLFVVGPILQFVILYRWAGSGVTAADRKSIRMTNLALAGIVLVISGTIGIGPFLHAFLPMYVLAAAIGSWLFFIQHVTEKTYWATDGTWDKKGALLGGSTFYDLPPVLRWCIANSGYHPLHHLNAGIPCYRLRECWEAHSDVFSGCPRITLRESLRHFRLALWDEEKNRMVGFDLAGR